MNHIFLSDYFFFCFCFLQVFAFLVQTYAAPQAESQATPVATEAEQQESSEQQFGQRVTTETQAADARQGRQYNSPEGNNSVPIISQRSDFGPDGSYNFR